jgi:hypothetical protein
MRRADCIATGIALCLGVATIAPAWAQTTTDQTPAANATPAPTSFAAQSNATPGATTSVAGQANATPAGGASGQPIGTAAATPVGASGAQAAPTAATAPTTAAVPTPAAASQTGTTGAAGVPEETVPVSSIVPPDVPRAADGYSLSAQPYGVQQLFVIQWGPNAWAEWVREHNAQLQASGGAPASASSGQTVNPATSTPTAAPTAATGAQSASTATTTVATPASTGAGAALTTTPAATTATGANATTTAVAPSGGGTPTPSGGP